MNLYISDLHFGHEKIIRLDERPFRDVEEMDKTMISLWNEKVSEEDQVYILGDICHHSEKPVEWYLKQLKGHKHLVLGNHDDSIGENPEALACLELVDNIMYVTEGDKKICLCHYPLAEWNGFYKGDWHIYGHIHNLRRESFEYIVTKERALNAAACINHYVPVSFEELIANNLEYKRAVGYTEFS